MGIVRREWRMEKIRLCDVTHLRRILGHAGWDVLREIRALEIHIPNLCSLPRNRNRRNWR